MQIRTEEELDAAIKTLDAMIDAEVPESDPKWDEIGDAVHAYEHRDAIDPAKDTAEKT